MPRFYQAPDYSAEVQYQPPMSSVSQASGEAVGGALMPDLEVLPVDREEFMGLMSNYQQRMDEYADKLRKDPNAIERLRPQMRDLQREVRTELLHGRGSELLARKRLADERIATTQAHFENMPGYSEYVVGDYLSRLTAGGGVEEARVPITLPYDVSMAELDSSLMGIADEMGTAITQELDVIKQHDLHSKSFVVFQEKAGKVKERIASRLANYLESDPSWAATFRIMGQQLGISDEEMAEVIAGRVNSIADAMVEEESSNYVREATNHELQAALRRRGEGEGEPNKLYSAIQATALGKDNVAVEWKDVGIMGLDWGITYDIEPESGLFQVRAEDMAAAYRGRVTEQFGGNSVRDGIIEIGMDLNPFDVEELQTGIANMHFGRVLHYEGNATPTLNPRDASREYRNILQKLGLREATKLRTGRTYAEIKKGTDVIWVEVNELQLGAMLLTTTPYNKYVDYLGRHYEGGTRTEDEGTDVGGLGW